MEKDPDIEVTVSQDPALEEPESGPERGAERPRRFSPLRWLGLVFGSLLAVGLDFLVIGLLGAASFVAVTLSDLPKTDVLREVRLQEPLRVFSADGFLMAEFGIQRRKPVAYDEIPPRLVQAFLATEDSRFFEHEGVDITGIGRAAVNYIKTGRRTQGGSTITMQVARNFFLTRERTFQRKFAELLLSLHIERTLSKEEILELYLNKIFFGHRAYGVSAAAALYYDKELNDLTTAEMAMLAGIPKAPSANNPVSNPKPAQDRRNHVLRRMRDLGYITEEEYQASLQEPIRANLHRREVDLNADYAAEMVRQEMVRRFGEDAYLAGYRVTTTVESWLQRAAEDALRKALLSYDRRHGYRGPEATHQVAGLSDAQLDGLLASALWLPNLQAGIVTRADAEEAEVYIGGGKRVSIGKKEVKWARPFKNENWRGSVPKEVTDAVAVGDQIRLRQDDEGTWALSQAPGVAGALVSISPGDGAVRALVGGYHFKASKFNRAVDARRQPGSSFKPFVYASALEKGYTPASLVRDERISIRGGDGKLWQPDNFDHKTLGRIPMRKALRLSRNLASVNLLDRVGLDYSREFIVRFGFDLRELPLGLSMVLGTAEVSPLQMAGAYAVFANGGFRIAPHFISRVENSAGEVVFETNAPRACDDCWFRYEESTATTASAEGKDAPQAERVIDPRLIYQMNSIMQDVIKRGTGRKALQLKRTDIAGKTGTTNDVRDSWFCGFQKDFVTVAWMGFDKFNPLGRGETGGQAGLGMWVDFMRQALKDKPQAVLDVPDRMVAVRSGGVVEQIREEYRNKLQGPKPVRAASSGGGKKKARRRAAPRVIDELF